MCLEMAKKEEDVNPTIPIRKKMVTIITVTKTCDFIFVSDLVNNALETFCLLYPISSFNRYL